MSIECCLSFVSNWSVLIPIVVAVIYINKPTANTILIFTVVTAAFIPQVLNGIDLKNKTIKNFTYNAYTPIEFLCFYILFYNYIQGRHARFIYKALGLVYLLFSISFVVNGDFINRFFDEWACINNLMYILWILYIFCEQYGSWETVLINASTSVFWIMFGLLNYASFSTLYFSVYTYAQEQNFSSLKIIHHIVNTMMYLCFAIGIYKDGIANNYAGLRHQNT